MDTRPRVHLHTLGCPKNEADSSSLARRLRALGVLMVEKPEKASHLLLNTCGFIEEAKTESIGAILAAAGEFPQHQLLVMGCLVQRYRRELEEQIPEVAGWFGLGEIEGLVATLTGTAVSQSGAEPADRAGSGSVLTPAVEREKGERAYAYVKVSDGCDHRCSFCAIPGIKGPYRALPLNVILEQAEAALAEGARELVLVGQDTAVWAEDGLDLPGLLTRLARYGELERLRLLYLQPEHVSAELLRFLASEPKICRYLDIPFQHGSRRVLRRMNRGGDASSYLTLLEQARALMPDVSLRSTFIVGFPGESDEDFEELVEFVQAAGFHYAGAFLYSTEEGTPAAALTPRIPDRVARGRLTRLSDILLSRAEVALNELIGTQVEVLVEAARSAPEGLGALGRTRGQAPEIDGLTYLTGPGSEALQRGMIVGATVTGILGLDIMARVDET